MTGLIVVADAPQIHKWWDVDYEGPDGLANDASASDVERQASGVQQRKLVSRPSIRNLRTVNAQDKYTSEQVAVHAQQYCVLITDVPDVQKMVMMR